jgi:hypothetical protein
MLLTPRQQIFIKNSQTCSNICKKMKNFNEILKSLGLRMLIAAPFFAIGWHLIAAAKNGWSSMPHLFFAMACFVVSAIVVAPPIARLISEPMGSIYYSEKRYIQPPPMYGAPESLREKGRYEEAMSEYEKIAVQYPEEIKPYIEMMDIAIVDLKDRVRAKAIFKRGLSSLQDDSVRDILKIAYATVTSEFSSHQR